MLDTSTCWTPSSSSANFDLNVCISLCCSAAFCFAAVSLHALAHCMNCFIVLSNCAESSLLNVPKKKVTNRSSEMFPCASAPMQRISSLLFSIVHSPSCIWPSLRRALPSSNSSASPTLPEPSRSNSPCTPSNNAARRSNSAAWNLLCLSKFISCSTSIDDDATFACESNRSCCHNC